jgi:hypothetical protein
MYMHVCRFFYSESLSLRTLPIIEIYAKLEHKGFGNWICFYLQVRKEDTHLDGSLRKS